MRGLKAGSDTVVEEKAAERPDKVLPVQCDDCHLKATS